MKRIANKVAVQTILYTVRPDQKIKIIDYNNVYYISNEKAPETTYEVVYEGNYGEVINHKTSKVVRALNSKLMYLTAEENTIVISVATYAEEF